MPRMSKKRKRELSFYLNDRGRVTYNELCRKPLSLLRAQLYTSSWQAPYHSFRRKRQNSFILLPLLSPQSFATLRGPREVIAFSEGSSPEGCDFPQSWSAPNQTGDATLPLRWLPPATLLWTCRDILLLKYGRVLYNEGNDIF